MKKSTEKYRVVLTANVNVKIEVETGQVKGKNDGENWLRIQIHCSQSC